MIIVDKPYISDFLIESLKKHYLPVLKTPLAEKLLGEGPFNFITPAEVIKDAAENNNFSIYTASENSIHWISEHLHFTSLPGNIALFKDKTRFRELTREMYPAFFFKTIRFTDLNTIDVTAFPFPFIIKPAVGFFSMGVYKVTEPADWPDIVKKINRDITGYQKLYPDAVLNTTQFIAEEVIHGEEYAFDAYFDENGEPVILGIMKHIFGSENDVSDRVYYTSAGVIKKNVGRFKEFLQKISRLTGLRNFPLHTEVRVDKQGIIAPIEINPLRFGAWCTSADLMHHAFNFNPYEYVCNRKKPDWDNLVKNAGDNYYSIVILDNSTGYPAEDIESFNFEKLLGNFEHPLELREIDFRTYPQFGFLFTETRGDNYPELEHILYSDLKAFVNIYDPH